MTNRINTLLYKNTCADENMFLLLVKNSKKLHICFSFSLKEKKIYKMLLNGNSKVDLWCSAKRDFESNHNLCKQNSSILYKTVPTSKYKTLFHHNHHNYKTNHWKRKYKLISRNLWSSRLKYQYAENLNLDVEVIRIKVM